jgi:vitamin B12 transporter
MPLRNLTRCLAAAITVHAIVAAAALAQDASRLDEIVVTATRLPTPLEEVASAITVITKADIERHQYQTLDEALAAAPGLAVVRLGPAGTQSAIFTRGTESNHTLVLLDGIEITDPSTADGAFNFSDILLDDVERIEIVRGPHSTLYGSDALGGVINILTRRGAGPVRTNAGFETGTQRTFIERAGVSGARGRLSYRLSAQHYLTDGESVTAPRLRPAGVDDEKDGFENANVSARLGFTTDFIDIDLIGRFIDTEVELDTSPEDPDTEGNSWQRFGRVQASFVLFQGLLDNRLGLAYTDYNRKTTDFADSLSTDFSLATNKGDKIKFDWQGDLHTFTNHVISLGLETEEDKAVSSSAFSNGFVSTTDARVRSDAGFVQVQSRFGDALSTALAVRADDHERFPTEVTWRVSAAYRVAPWGTRLKAAYGTGFKAPSLQQLFGANSFGGFGIFVGNPNLSPETSDGFDIGFEQDFANRRMRVGLSYFEITIDDLIAFNGTFTSLVNQDRADIYGFEGFAALALDPKLTLRTDYTYTRSEDGTGLDLLRRPKHKLSLDANWRPRDAVQFSAGAVFTGRRTDIDAVSFTRIKTSSYAVARLGASYRLGQRWTLVGRIDNVLDKDYQTADGFQGLGRAALAGFRWRM